MKNKHFRTFPKNEDNRFYVGDVLQYLSGLAELHKNGKTANIKLSNGLQAVVDVLQPYSGYSVSELANTDITTLVYPPQTIWGGNKPELPTGLETVSQEAIEKILADENYTKQQVVELGVRRFGISKSKLNRLRKKDVQELVRASLEHEKTLDVISEEARKGGKSRSV